MRQQRIWEIDLVRGAAILLMIMFHIIFDLTAYYSYQFNYLSGFWFYIGKAAAMIFILICGVSSTLGSAPFRHGLLLLGWGLAITVITYLYQPALYIRFGILHLLGVSLLSSPLIRRLPPALTAACGFIALLAGNLMTRITVTTDYLLVVGLTSPSFSSLDYYPLFPWYGVFLLGTAAGRILYPARRALVPVRYQFTNPLNWLGRHSLPVYLIHQPVILAGLFILKP